MNGILGFIGSILGGILGGIATVLFTHHYPEWLKKRNNWVEVQKRKLHRLPYVPDYLQEFFPVNVKTISKDIQIKDVKPAGGQSWNRLNPSQREVLFQIYEWLGGNREDYEAQRIALLPKHSPQVGRWEH